MSNWVIYCTGSSITGRTEELKEHFKNWGNSIAVNKAVLDFPSTYWAFLDALVYDAYPAGRDRKMVVSRLVSAIVKKRHKDVKDGTFYHIADVCPSNSGIFAIQYALLQGATNIVTCGFDLSDNWGYYNEETPKSKNSYPRLMRESFRRLNKTRAKVYSVDPNNKLGLKFYDTTKGEL